MTKEAYKILFPTSIQIQTLELFIQYASEHETITRDITP